MFDVMLPALAVCLVLIGVHAYLGVHIIARGVIFVDLALAQMAALGWAATELGLTEPIVSRLGIPHGLASYFSGLAASLVAAALFSVTRLEHRRIPQEAIIGIVYVVASAATILMAAQAPRGHEHVEDLLTGNLLWVTWPEIWRTAVIYVPVVVIHWLLRDRFIAISMEPDRAREAGWAVARWDFLFYSLFGVVVTSSVAIAGVLVVFSFLVIPAVIAFLFTASPAALFALASLSGTAAAILGLYVSYLSDLPTGPTVVCAFAFALALAFVLRRVLPGRAGESVGA